MAKKKPFYPLYYTILNDCMNWGIVLTIFAPMLMDPKSGMLSSDTSHEVRTIWVGVLLAIFAMGQFIMAPVIGAFSDQYGRKKSIDRNFVGLFYLQCLFSHWNLGRFDYDSFSFPTSRWRFLRKPSPRSSIDR